MKRYVIIGNGPAGASAAETIRGIDARAMITIVTDEQYPFYRREHLPRLVSGEETEEGLFEKGRDFHHRIGAELVYGRVVRVSPTDCSLSLNTGDVIQYDALLIASGGIPVLPSVPGIQLGGVTPLYTLDDAKKIAELERTARVALVIGGGTIALKVAPLLKGSGLRVILVEKTDRLWPMMLDDRASELLGDKLGVNGIELVLNDEVVEFIGEAGQLRAASLKNGRLVQCDLALVAAGMRPRVDFLRESGLKFDRGLVVDSHLRTSAANIFAAGDVAQCPDPLFTSPALHPTWSYAEEQGVVAARNMLGMGQTYEGAVPLFSIALYDLGILVAGITRADAGCEEVSRFIPGQDFYRKFVLRRNKLAGAVLIEKGLNRKALKPLVKKALLKSAAVDESGLGILKKGLDFAAI